MGVQVGESGLGWRLKAQLREIPSPGRAEREDQGTRNHQQSTSRKNNSKDSTKADLNFTDSTKLIVNITNEDDNEDKLIVAPDGMVFHQAEIAAAVHFQEQHFDYTVETVPGNTVHPTAS